MIHKDLKKYSEDHDWKQYSATATELSRGGIDDLPLVVSERLFFNFDKISQSYYQTDSYPASVDALCIDENKVDLIEFKKGFRKKLSKESLDPSRTYCEYLQTNEKIEYVCKDYWDLFWDNQKKIDNELINNLKLKAVESYITLDKEILPLCGECETKKTLNLLVVIDGDPVDRMENILGDLAGKHKPNNYHERIKRSLSRYQRKQSKEYYYDSIKIISPSEFNNLYSCNN